MLFHCSCINLTALGTATYSICRMISCISHSPIKHSLVMFAHCVKLQVISEKIPGTENFQDPRSPLRTDSEHAFSLFSFLCFASALHFSTTKSKDCGSVVTQAVNSQKTEDFCHHSYLLFEWHFASTGERILPFLKSNKQTAVKPLDFSNSKFCHGNCMEIWPFKILSFFWFC